MILLVIYICTFYQVLCGVSVFVGAYLIARVWCLCAFVGTRDQDHICIDWTLDFVYLCGSFLQVLELFYVIEQVCRLFK